MVDAAIDVWIVRPETLPAAHLERCMEWLSGEERAQHARFVTAALRREYLVTRALSRWALTRRVPSVAPEAWAFERTAAGRPFVSPKGAPAFNLSNTPGLVVCAVTAAAPIGVDVEGCDLTPDLRALLAPGETARFAGLSDPERARHAVELWTLKEAYLKADGGGIVRRMHRVEVTPHAPDRDDGWRRFGVRGERWDLAVRVVAARFVLAVASGPSPAGEARSICVRPGLETPPDGRDAA